MGDCVGKGSSAEQSYGGQTGKGRSLGSGSCSRSGRGKGVTRIEIFWWCEMVASSASRLCCG